MGLKFEEGRKYKRHYDGRNGFEGFITVKIIKISKNTDYFEDVFKVQHETTGNIQELGASVFTGQDGWSLAD